jgi:YidC/Oxa1 family membrane protein insertase
LDNRRLLLAAALSLGVLVAWQILFPGETPRRPPATATATAPTPGNEERPAEGRPANVAAQPASKAESPATAVQAAPAPPAAAQEESRVFLETPRFRAEFSNRGAQLVSFVLAGHRDSDGKPLDLVRRRANWPLPFGLVAADGSGLPLNEALFVAETAVKDELRFRYSGPLGQAEKVFQLTDGRISFEIDVPHSPGYGILLGQGVRNPSGTELKSQFARRMASWGSAGGSVGGIDSKKLEGASVPGAGLEWIALEDNYFVVAVLPEAFSGTVVVRPLLEEPTTGGAAPAFSLAPTKDKLVAPQKDWNRELEVILSPQAAKFRGTAFFGAKEYDDLAVLGVGLEKTVRWGTFGFLARPLLRALQWTHAHVVANYGWSIILMTILINLLLLPLNHKSYVSMRKMQALNPRMEAIKERWRGKLKDKQGRPNAEAQRKMQEETNALFKAEGVNPMGGCLPILLQMPLLFAFYSLLSTAVELRGAPWTAWIHDLSAADPYYILPSVMGLTQFVQQRMTPAVGDPMQRRLFQFMPIFFTILFLGFPAGLVLYWLVSNLMGVIRQAVYNRLQAREAVAK